jgi:hypothetical protein
VEDVMNLCLHGSPAECAAATERLRRTPGIPSTDESRPYPDPAGELVRVDLTVQLDSTSGRQPGPSAGARGGRRR